MRRIFLLRCFSRILSTGFSRNAQQIITVAFLKQRNIVLRTCSKSFSQLIAYNRSVSICGLTLFGYTLWPKTDDESIRDLPVEAAATHLLRKAVYQHWIGENSEAEKVFHDLLIFLEEKLANEELSKEKWIFYQARVHDEMANFYMQQSDWERCEKLFKATLSALAEINALDDMMLLEISLKLANMYAGCSRMNEAELGYSFCVQTISSKLNEIDTSVLSTDDIQNMKAMGGIIYTSFAKFCFLRNQLDLCCRYLTLALKISDELYSCDSIRSANLLNDIGVTYFRMGKYDLAQTFLRNALVKLRKVKPLYSSRSSGQEEFVYPHIFLRDEDPVYLEASVLCNLGEVYKASGNQSKSKRHCLEAKDLCETVHDNELNKKVRDCFLPLPS